ncbi:hypothetical protein AB0F43_38180 [Kribbella sp. NPDC023972]|uniref:hypothetical protein n=1 Tax=Kribbella sp. NPDC023972 TaxID=3154795 RepID=UPI003404ED0E
MPRWSAWSTWAPADAGVDQSGEVTVAAVLAQQRRCVPKAGDRLVRYGQRPQRGVQDPSLRSGQQGGPAL